MRRLLLAALLFGLTGAAAAQVFPCKRPYVHDHRLLFRLRNALISKVLAGTTGEATRGAGQERGGRKISDETVADGSERLRCPTNSLAGWKKPDSAGSSATSG